MEKRVKKIWLALPLLFALGIMLLNPGCRKDLLMSDDNLTFSTDTVVFDTVFTTVGSSTRRFKIYNPSSNPVKISSVTLDGGGDSPYRINLDGEPGTSFKDVTIPGEDSLFVFVEVTLDPNNMTTPLVVEDQVHFITNGVEQAVQLAAWGQDAYFHYQDTNEGVWPKDKPHVIYDYALVDSSKALTIQDGTRIHLHKNSLLVIRKATLTIDGTAEDKVIFEGDRLETFYEDVKGQYYGIYFDHALSSTIDHAIIKNGTAGVHLFGDAPSNTDYTLTITNSEIFNHASYGIFNYSGASIHGENLNVHNNTQYAFFLLEGGNYNFQHSQFLSFGSDGNQPAMAIKNYFTRDDGFTYVGPINQGEIYNSIIYGGGENQIAYDTINNGGSVDISYEFENNLIQQEETFEGENGFANNIWNTDPLFEDPSSLLYKITSNSPCRDAGSSAYAVSTDIEGNSRDMTNPDIGAFEIN